MFLLPRQFGSANASQFHGGVGKALTIDLVTLHPFQSGRGREGGSVVHFLRCGLSKDDVAHGQGNRQGRTVRSSKSDFPR